MIPPAPETGRSDCLSATSRRPAPAVAGSPANTRRCRWTWRRKAAHDQQIIDGSRRIQRSHGLDAIPRVPQDVNRRARRSVGDAIDRANDSCDAWQVDAVDEPRRINGSIEQPHTMPGGGPEIVGINREVEVGGPEGNAVLKLKRAVRKSRVGEEKRENEENRCHPPAHADDCNAATARALSTYEGCGTLSISLGWIHA
jgi:hypothetical protein